MPRCHTLYAGVAARCSSEQLDRNYAARVLTAVLATVSLAGVAIVVVIVTVTVQRVLARVPLPSPYTFCERGRMPSHPTGLPRLSDCGPDGSCSISLEENTIGRYLLIECKKLGNSEC